MEDDPGIVKVPLAVALTRPSGKYGIPYEALVVVVTGSMVAMIVTSNLVSLGYAIPLLAICYLMCKHEPRIFELIWLWLCTTFLTLVRTRFYWSGSSYSPLTLRPPPSAIQLRHLRVQRWIRQFMENYHANC